MKLGTLVVALFLLLGAGGYPRPESVPAVQETRQPDAPCNLPSGNFTVCLTGPYQAWTCADKSMVLLTAEDGTRQCVKFDLLRGHN